MTHGPLHRFAMLASLMAMSMNIHALPHSRAVRAAFQKQHPCPANGHKRGACPGFVVDHRIALCVGGRDEIQNMQWMTTADAKAKDRWECKPGWEKRLSD